MRLTGITLQGFKAIESAELRLAPLTILIGRNNVGKSSVLQAPALIAQSAMQQQVMPSGPLVDLGQDTESMSHGYSRSSRMKPFKIGLHWETTMSEWNPTLPAAPIAISYIAEFGPNRAISSSTRYETEAPQGRPVILEAQPPGPSSGVLMKANEVRSDRRQVPGFEVLLPYASQSPWWSQPQGPLQAVGMDAVNDGNPEAVRNFVLVGLQPIYAGGLLQAMQAFRYVSASRHVDNSVFDLGHIPVDNPRTANELIDTLSYNENILQAVSERCVQLFGYGIDKDLIPNRKVSLVAIGQGRQRHNIVHVGAGLIQMVWIIAQLELARIPRPGSPTAVSAAVGIEEPELHLHPAAQPDVARLLLEFSRSMTVICTTQSEHLLMSLLTLVLEGAAKPEDIAVYYVDAGRVDRMAVDERGQITGCLLYTSPSPRD